MNPRTMKLGAGFIVAIVLLMLPVPAAAQSNSAPRTIATLGGTTELPSAPSSTRGSEVATALPAGPGIGSPAAFPPAPALITPVRNATGEKRPELPRKTFYSLALLQHSAVAFDAWSTRRLVDAGGRELNPLLKPIAGSAALYPVMQTWPVAIDYLAVRMARSNKPWVRKMWWVPQTACAASSFVIGARNVSLANNSQKLIK